MRKYKFEYDPELVDGFIREIQGKLPDYKVNVNNVNDFAQMLRDKECCRVCKALGECGNFEPGYYTDYVDGQFVSKMCRFKRDDKIKNNKESLIKTLYLPAKVLEARLEDFDINSESRRKIFARISSFITNYKTHQNPKGLYLFGGFAIGKTFALSCIANELCKNDISSLLIYFPDLVVDLKSALGTPRFEKLINMLKSVDVLMLDDMGSENMTPWIRDEILGPIVNYRVLEGKPIFLSSNLAPGQLKAHLAIDNQQGNQLKSDRIFSRLQFLLDGINMDDSNKYNR